MLLPHDCRRVFASEHLNNNTPVHVIQALLSHASPETMMIYAKLYPGRLVKEYRKTVRSLYNAHYGEDGLKNPTADE
jgi:site-specific recombinase XerD